MSSRQLRKLRREQERKSRKPAYKAGLKPAAAAEPAAPASRPAPAADPFEDEFTPEFLAEARAMRARVESRVAGMKQRPATEQSPAPPPCLYENSGLAPENQPPARPEFGFISQNEAPSSAPAKETGFVSQSRAAINRANATQSTGPRSLSGKLASSRNSLKHGLASGQLIIRGEDRAAFEALLNDLLAEHRPANTTEEMLIQQIAQSWWLMQRALRFQNECFTADRIDEKRLALFLRYQATHERAFHKASTHSFGSNGAARLSKRRMQAVRSPTINRASFRKTICNPKPKLASFRKTMRHRSSTLCEPKKHTRRGRQRPRD